MDGLGRHSTRGNTAVSTRAGTLPLVPTVSTIELRSRTPLVPHGVGIRKHKQPGLRPRTKVVVKISDGAVVSPLPLGAGGALAATSLTVPMPRIM